MTRAPSTSNFPWIRPHLSTTRPLLSASATKITACSAELHPLVRVPLSQSTARTGCHTAWPPRSRTNLPWTCGTRPMINTRSRRATSESTSSSFQWLLQSRWWATSSSTESLVQTNKSSGRMWKTTGSRKTIPSACTGSNSQQLVFSPGTGMRIELCKQMDPLRCWALPLPLLQPLCSFSDELKGFAFL